MYVLFSFIANRNAVTFRNGGNLVITPLLLNYRPRVVDLSFIVIFYAKASMRYALLFDYFSRFVNNFLCYFFQKQAPKDHLTQGNLKTTLLNEKQSNFEKEMYEISLYTPNIFHLGLEVMFT